ncbi:MAG TPA: hypothetical protein VN675_02515 [Burkholderiales bacterium]|nr:hypothetical protein [Burkholderiales bacterium]
MSDANVVEALSHELRLLAGPLLGPSHRGIQRVREIVAELRQFHDAYVKQRATEILDDFELWFSSQWQRYEREPDDFRMRLLTSIEKLEHALNGTP